MEGRKKGERKNITSEAQGTDQFGFIASVLSSFSPMYIQIFTSDD